MHEASEVTPEIEAIKNKIKSIWSSGNFGKIAVSLESGAEEFIQRLHLQTEERVLDVACGSGNLAIPAALTGAHVTGVDIVPNLLEQARARASQANVRCKFDEGDAEHLPYLNASFDTVVSMFGVMFAPRPEVIAAELVRVCRPGGRIALANWTPTGFIGKMFKVTAQHLPLSSTIPSPILWGNAETVRQRLRENISTLNLVPRLLTFRFSFSPKETVEYFRQWYGPTNAAFAALNNDQQKDLRKDLEQLWEENNQATDGTTEVVSEYLEVIARRK